ncbi:Uncharacterised protein [Enterobacter hormaechei]|nr:Uncharacterised protein [Enterobacter hormaechei]
MLKTLQRTDMCQGIYDVNYILLIVLKSTI